jgi:hypothetical protein
MSVIDFTDRESRIIGMMLSASTTVPNDMWAVAIVQNLACLLAKIESVLTDEQAATLIGIGGYIAHVGRDEMKAEIGMRMAFGRAGAAPLKDFNEVKRDAQDQ